MMKRLVGLRSGPALVGLILAVGMPTAYAAASVQARQQAAAAVASSSTQCKVLGDFYWEIGDANGPLGSGTIGSNYNANKTVRIASASKFVFGAYVLEKIGRSNQPTPEQLNYLEMGSGYASFNPVMCAFSRSVVGCGSIRSNGDRDPSKIGKFSYGGGHDQQLAAQLGMGAMNADQFRAEVLKYIGPELGFSYKSPQPAGGMESTPAQFAQFLRKVISGQLRLKQFLGYSPVCAAPNCANVAYTPVKDNWHYSVNHWIEDDPRTGDGSFSSPGALGFYPWISQDKTTYGVLAREKISADAAWESVLCGREIRKAWMSTGG